MYILQVEAARTLSDTAGSEAGSRSIRGAGIEGGSCLGINKCAGFQLNSCVLRTYEGNVIFFVVASETWEVGQAAKGRDARED